MASSQPRPGEKREADAAPAAVPQPPPKRQKQESGVTTRTDKLIEFMIQDSDANIMITPKAGPPCYAHRLVIRECDAKVLRAAVENKGASSDGLIQIDMSMYTSETVNLFLNTLYFHYRQGDISAWLEKNCAKAVIDVTESDVKNTDSGDGMDTWTMAAYDSDVQKIVELVQIAHQYDAPAVEAACVKYCLPRLHGVMILPMFEFLRRAGMMAAGVADACSLLETINVDTAIPDQVFWMRVLRNIARRCIDARANAAAPPVFLRRLSTLGGLLVAMQANTRLNSVRSIAIAMFGRIIGRCIAPNPETLWYPINAEHERANRLAASEAIETYINIGGEGSPFVAELSVALSTKDDHAVMYQLRQAETTNYRMLNRGASGSGECHITAHASNTWLRDLEYSVDQTLGGFPGGGGGASSGGASSGGASSGGASSGSAGSGSASSGGASSGSASSGSAGSDFGFGFGTSGAGGSSGAGAHAVDGPSFSNPFGGTPGNADAVPMFGWPSIGKK
jgi:hypothetical protein